jgi:hypothetical protein
MGPQVDLVVRDRDNRNVLIVEVKSRPVSASSLPFSAALRSASEKVPFSMLVDPEKVLIFRGGFGDLSKPVCILNTKDILQHYDPEFANKRIFDPYFTTLVDAWLRDLAYHWSHPNPPAAPELESIGLLQELSDGTTEAEVTV